MDAISVKIIPILKKFNIKKASLFGSYVRGEQNLKSDIDLLIEPPSGMSLFDLAGMKIEIDKILEKNTDIVTYRSIDPLLKDIILNEEKVFYEKK